MSRSGEAECNVGPRGGGEGVCVRQWGIIRRGVAQGDRVEG